MIGSFLSVDKPLRIVVPGPLSNKQMIKHHSRNLSKKPLKPSQISPSLQFQTISKQSRSSKTSGKSVNAVQPESESHALMELEKEALEAFKNNDEASFTDILSRTPSLLGRDKGVMLATSAGWTQAVDKLLIRNHSTTKYPYFEGINDVLMCYYFNYVVPETVPGLPSPRWLIQKALLQAIKHKRYEIFMMLLPVVGVNFVDNSIDGPFTYAYDYCIEAPDLTRFLRPILAAMSPRTSPMIISRYLIDLSYTGHTEMIPEFFDKLFPRYMSESRKAEVALKNSICNGKDEMMKCLFEQLERFFPGYNNAANLYLAVEAKNLSIIRYLVQNHHHSYSLDEYGLQGAVMLEHFLKKVNALELYDIIIRSD